jgi:hypothetical protein
MAAFDESLLERDYQVQPGAGMIKRSNCPV